jgi:molecular chaperone DnaK
MRRDAESHAEEDKKQREEIEVRNETDNAVYRSEKMLRDNADKISASDKGRIEEAIKGAQDALKGSDVTAMKSASEKLNQVWQTVSAELYKAASEKARAGQAQGGARPEGGQEGTGGAGGGKDEGPIIDAEVVDDNKK